MNIPLPNQIISGVAKQEIINSLKLQSSQVPNLSVSRTIVPTIEINPKLVKNVLVASANKATTGAMTSLAAMTDREVYLCSVQLSVRKNATCDMASGYFGMYCTINGLTTYLIDCATITTTAEAFDYSIVFEHPIKIDLNTAVSVGGNFTAGVLVRASSITYYTEDVKTGS